MGLRYRLFLYKDTYGADLLGEGRLGDVMVTYKVKEGLWQTLPRGNRQMDVNNDVLTYTDRGMGDAMVITQSFRQEKETLHWSITLENRSTFPVEIGDLAVTIPWKSSSSEEPKEIFERSFIKHAFISGDASFFYFTRFNDTTGRNIFHGLIMMHQSIAQSLNQPDLKKMKLFLRGKSLPVVLVNIEMI